MKYIIQCDVARIPEIFPRFTGTLNATAWKGNPPESLQCIGFDWDGKVFRMSTTRDFVRDIAYLGSDGKPAIIPCYARADWNEIAPDENIVELKEIPA